MFMVYSLIGLFAFGYSSLFSRSVNCCFHCWYRFSYCAVLLGCTVAMGFALAKASFGLLYTPAPIPAPIAAPTLPSQLYNSTGTFNVFTKLSVNTSLKKRLALPARITFGYMPFSFIMSSPYRN